MTDNQPQPPVPIGGYNVKGIVRSDGSGSSVHVELTPAPAIVSIGSKGKPRKTPTNGRIHLPVLVALPPDLAERLGQDLLKQAITARVVQSVAKAGPEGVARLITPPPPHEEEGDEDE